jgi:hypothetical protein
MPSESVPSASNDPSRRRALLRIAAPSLLTVCSGSAMATASHMRCLVNAQSTTPAAPWGTTGGPDAWVRVRLVEITTATRSAQSSGQGGAAKGSSPQGNAPAGAAEGGAKASPDQALPKTGSTLPIPDGSAATPASSEGAVQPNSRGPSPPQSVTRYYIRGSDLKDETRRPYRICPSSGSPVPADGKWLEINVTTYTAVGGPIDPPAAASTANPANHWVIVRFDQDGCITGIGTGSPGAIIGNSCWASAGPLIPRAL